MLESAFIRCVLYANTFIWICATFTIATILDLVLTVAVYGDIGTTYGHLGTRLILCTFVSVSLLAFRLFKKLHFVLIIAIHFAVFLLFTVAYVWITGFFIAQHPRAMFYMVRTVMIIYPIIAGSLIGVDFLIKIWRKRKTESAGK